MQVNWSETGGEAKPNQLLISHLSLYVLRSLSTWMQIEDRTDTQTLTTSPFHLFIYRYSAHHILYIPRTYMQTYVQLPAWKIDWPFDYLRLRNQHTHTHTHWGCITALISRFLSMDSWRVSRQSLSCCWRNATPLPSKETIMLVWPTGIGWFGCVSCSGLMTSSSSGSPYQARRLFRFWIKKGWAKYIEAFLLESQILFSFFLLLVKCI